MVYSVFTTAHRSIPSGLPPWTKFAGLAVLGLSLSACSDVSGGGGEGTKTSQKALEQVEEQHVQFVVQGSVDNSASPTAQSSGAPLADDTHVYRPARGTGKKDYIRRGSNDEGPYSFVVYTEAVHEAHSEEPTRTFVTFNLPKGAQPGTYAVSSLPEADDNEVQARVTGAGYGWIYGVNVDGVVEIDTLGDELTAAWDITAEDRSQREVQVSGAVKNLPFTPQVELFYTYDIDGEQTEKRMRTGYSQRDDRLELVGGASAVNLTLPKGITPGDYEAGKINEGGIPISISGLKYDELTGSVTITENGSDYYDVDFNFTTEGTDNVKAEGGYRYIPLEFL